MVGRGAHAALLGKTRGAFAVGKVPGRMTNRNTVRWALVSRADARLLGLHTDVTRETLAVGKVPEWVTIRLGNAVLRAGVGRHALAVLQRGTSGTFPQFSLSGIVSRLWMKRNMKLENFFG